MENIPNRKQRRLLAKQAGYLEKRRNSSFEEQLAMLNRSQEMGKQIHLSNTEKLLRAQDEAIRQVEQRRIDTLISQGVSPEDALKSIRGENDESL